MLELGDAWHLLYHICVWLSLTFVSPSEVIISEWVSSKGFANHIEGRGLQTAVIAVLFSSLKSLVGFAAPPPPFACEPAHLFGYFYPHGVQLYLDLALGPWHCSMNLVAHWTKCFIWMYNSERRKCANGVNKVRQGPGNSEVWLSGIRLI